VTTGVLTTILFYYTPSKSRKAAQKTTGIEMPFYPYKTRLRGLKIEPTQVGFVNVDRGFIPVCL
jgi:hypothetical protein